jgi:radical SAM superfamily enzyme YgiQ (UPF0313 family)
MEDVEEIAALAREIESLYYRRPFEKRKRKLELTVSTSMFIPKPFTPFQWEPQDTRNPWTRNANFSGSGCAAEHPVPVARPGYLFH